MPYVTFGQDMRSVKGEAQATLKDMGRAIAGNIKDPFAMFPPLVGGMLLLLGCLVKAGWYVLRKVVG